MKMQGRSVMMFIAMSLDGYIAGPGDDLGFLGQVEREGEDYGYRLMMDEVDTVVLGRRTYDQVIRINGELAYGDRETYVVSRQSFEGRGKLHFHQGDPALLIHMLRLRPGGKILVDGGAEILHDLFWHRQIDECIISVIPVMLGNGVKLFRDDRPKQELKLVQAKTYDSGLMQLHYTIHQNRHYSIQ
ncbi:MAG TPA: dihydrofolate reductase family protein [Ferruginibacter sp.]|nr:dihydrofolate reductase family protein [Ferruginibacter sp.]